MCLWGGHQYILLVLCRNAFLLQMLVRAEFHVLFAGLFPVETQTSTANKHPLKIHGRTYRDWQDCCRPTAALKGLRQRVSTSVQATGLNYRLQGKFALARFWNLVNHTPELDPRKYSAFAFAFSAQSSANQTQEMIPLCFHDRMACFSAFESILDLSAQIFIWSYCHIGLSQILPGCYWWKAGQAAWLPVSQVAEDLWRRANNSCLLGPEVRSGSVGFVNGNLDSKEERLLRPTFWKALPHLRWRPQHASQGYSWTIQCTHVTTMICDHSIYNLVFWHLLFIPQYRCRLDK